jgi:hypothetical protein
MSVSSLGKPYGNVCDIARKALGICVTSLERPYGNVCDIVRKALRKCV